MLNRFLAPRSRPLADPLDFVATACDGQEALQLIDDGLRPSLVTDP